ncbi:MAG: oligosaccharide flippase family protein [Bacteroidota bacterium]
MAGYLAKILKNHNFLSLANNGAVAIFGFFSFIILVRSLPTYEFGEWVLFITMLNFLDMLRFGITRTAIVRFLSGANKTEGRQLIGSNYVINLATTLFLISIVMLINFFFSSTIDASGFTLFFTWFPIVAIINLPFNNSLSVLQAKLRFDRILIIRVINIGSFMLFLIVNYIFFQASIIVIMWAYIITNIFTSIIAASQNWDGIRYIFRAKMSTNRIILNFGKYTSGTLIGSNLLKSADAFILGLSPFIGVTGVALYSIPLKLTEIMEIPVRSFAMTVFPKMSKASIEGKKDMVKELYYKNVGGLTFMLLPLLAFSFIFAEEFVTILGGPEYKETASVFRIFCIYGLLLPFDRFTGVALDSINMPKQNFIKVIYMTLANIIGDAIVVFGLYYIILAVSVVTLISVGYTNVEVISASAKMYTTITVLNMVAVITILFTVIGIFVGTYFLRKTLDLKLRFVFKGGVLFFKEVVNMYIAKKT